MSDVIVAKPSTPHRDKSLTGNDLSNEAEGDDWLLSRGDELNDVTTYNHAPPPLPPRRCRMPPESPSPAPPVPPRTRFSQVITSTPHCIDEQLGDVWIHQDDSLGVRHPPLPVPRRPVSGYGSVSTCSTTEHRRSNATPDLLPRNSQPRRRLTSETRPPPPPPPSPPPTSFSHGVVIGQLVDEADFTADELRMVTKAWRCPCCARATNIVGAGSCSAGGPNNNVISLTSQRRRCILSQSSVSPLGFRFANQRIVQVPVLTNAGVSSINSINATRNHQRRVANEYVDDPIASSALTSTGFPRKQQTNGNRTSHRQRFILFVSAPALVTPVTPDAASLTGSRHLRATNAIESGAHRVMMTSPNVRSSAIEVIDISPTTDEDDKAEVDSVADHQHCSSVCCGRPRRSRSIGGEQGRGSGCRSSLISALCLPGMWLVRHAKETYRRRSHAATASTSGDKRQLDGSDELHDENLSRTIDVLHDSSVT